jgi:hypothetical protein
MTGYYDPEQEQCWAAERHSCLVRACIADPALANGVLATRLNYVIVELNKAERQSIGHALFEDIADWIAKNPFQGKKLLDQWDRIQPKSRRDHLDPNYAEPLRRRARQIWLQLNEETECQDST